METLQRSANRGSVSTGFTVNNSIKLEIDNNEYLYRNNPTAGNKKTFTFSLWLKRASLGHKPAGDDEYFMGQGSNARWHFAGDTIRYMFESGSTELESIQEFRDPAGWYHIVLAVDTSQSTASDRVKLYRNGVEISWSNTKFPSLNQESDWMNTNDLFVGVRFAGDNAGDGDNDLAGYMTEIVCLDGTQASPTDFGEFNSNGIWVPKDASGLTFGNQGFYLKFENASSLGTDSSGNGNNLVLNNLTAVDQAIDTCTNNFATLNPLYKYPSSQKISEGGTKVSRSSGSGLNKTFYSTFAMTAGKFYFEAQPTSGSNMIGVESITTAASVDADGVFVGEQSTGVGYYFNGQKFVNNSGSSYGDSYSNSDIIGVALDMDNRKIYFAKNNTYQNSGDPTSGATGTGAIDLPDTSDGYHFAVSYDSGGTWLVNFGGFTTMSISSAVSDGNSRGSFEFAPPTGYLSLCSLNLGESGG